MWDRFAASDPGLLRLTAGLRTVSAIALALVVLALLDTGVSHMVAGAMTAMTATFAIKDKLVRDQAVTLALGLPVALVAISLGALLTSQIIAGDLFFVVLIFGAVYSPAVRRAWHGTWPHRLPGLLPRTVRRCRHGRAAGALSVADRRIRLQRAGTVRHRSGNAPTCPDTTARRLPHATGSTRVHADRAARQQAPSSWRRFSTTCASAPRGCMRRP